MSENKFKTLTSINTKDGSPTLEIQGVEETYHSRHGAVQESMHVFIENGLKKLLDSYREIKILEVGLGTSLNLLLTSLYLLGRKNIHIHYYALEKYPLDKKLNASLDFAGAVNNYFPEIEPSYVSDLFKELIYSEWGREIALNENMSFFKDPTGLLEAELKTYDLIYYDAFGPRAQSEMWELNCFQKLTPQVKKGGILVTYCTQGQFRRNLKSLGWEVNKVPGPPGKREMVVAVKTT